MAVFAACGMYQLSRLKDRCLAHCRSPLALLLHYGSYQGRFRDLRAGAHHGGYCLGCCWGLMVILIAVGVMNVAAMVGLAALVLVEKTWRRGPAAGRLARYRRAGPRGGRDLVSLARPGPARRTPDDDLTCVAYADTVAVSPAEEGAMSYARQMLDSHPRTFNLDAGVLAATIDALTDCTQACTADVDADLGEQDLAEMVKCIRLCLDCVDVCTATAGVVSRLAEYDANVTRPLLEACVAICKSCGDECERHARRTLSTAGSALRHADAASRPAGSSWLS